LAAHAARSWNDATSSALCHSLTISSSLKSFIVVCMMTTKLGLVSLQQRGEEVVVVG
jgi:hypothetical protein